MVSGKRMATHYEELLVWQKAMDLVDLTYSFTRTFLQNELYGLTSQLKRSVVSIPSNIAEGAARETTKDFLRFLTIAQGSLAEAKTQAQIALRKKFISETEFKNFLSHGDEVGRMLHGLQKSLRLKLATNHLSLAT